MAGPLDDMVLKVSHLETAFMSCVNSQNHLHLSKLVSLATTGPQLILHSDIIQSGQDDVSCNLILFGAISSLMNDVLDPMLLQLGFLGFLPLHLTVAGSSTASLKAVVALLHQGEVRGSRAVLESAKDVLGRLGVFMSGISDVEQVCLAPPSTETGTVGLASVTGPRGQGVNDGPTEVGHREVVGKAVSKEVMMNKAAINDQTEEYPEGGGTRNSLASMQPYPSISPELDVAGEQNDLCDQVEVSRYQEESSGGREVPRFLDEEEVQSCNLVSKQQEVHQVQRRRSSEDQMFPNFGAEEQLDYEPEEAEEEHREVKETGGLMEPDVKGAVELDGSVVQDKNSAVKDATDLEELNVKETGELGESEVEDACQLEELEVRDDGELEEPAVDTQQKEADYMYSAKKASSGKIVKEASANGAGDGKLERKDSGDKKRKATQEQGEGSPGEKKVKASPVGHREVVGKAVVKEVIFTETPNLEVGQDITEQMLVEDDSGVEVERTGNKAPGGSVEALVVREDSLDKFSSASRDGNSKIMVAQKLKISPRLQGSFLWQGTIIARKPLAFSLACTISSKIPGFCADTWPPQLRVNFLTRVQVDALSPEEFVPGMSKLRSSKRADIQFGDQSSREVMVKNIQAGGAGFIHDFKFNKIMFVIKDNKDRLYGYIPVDQAWYKRRVEVIFDRKRQEQKQAKTGREVEELQVKPGDVSVILEDVVNIRSKKERMEIVTRKNFMILPTVKKEQDDPEGPVCRKCPPGKGSNTTDAGMAAHSKKHSNVEVRWCICRQCRSQFEANFDLTNVCIFLVLS